ncbi:hypothetical protein TNCV_3026751 [Trichonephila clavipes]|nr:hypothetical protein TNCV_3026751 [Trichonephila clavipes]
MLEKVIENWVSRLDYIRASRGSPMPEIIFKMILQQYPQNKSQKIFIPSKALKHNYQCLKTHVCKRLSTRKAELIASQDNAHYLLVEIRITLVPASFSIYRRGKTTRNITARVIERDVSGPLHKFLEESRGFRTRQHGHQSR